MSSSYGHGLAFFLASVGFELPPNSGASILGLFNTTTIYTPWNVSSHNGDNGNVWIVYNASTKNLSVSWSYQRTSDSQENTSLFYHIDLSKVLPEWVTIGFSAATGNDHVEKLTLLSWEFSSSMDIK
ncbi:hypothetical protein FH972_019705 [Carpinus fangiana]|uniref:Legume lectin domain-containing protein n=1 Tax=Carpinus fangiana TaxID=176857 RepID=A0A5N6RR29_9ROSI|nr:hypothetical protein FH972_019705 [Carpinus fangiana]